MAFSVLKNSKIFDQNYFFQLFRTEKRLKKCISQHSGAFLTESTPFFQESRHTDKNQTLILRQACKIRSLRRPVSL